MIITRLNGGLGNQMFQYAVAKKLAIQFNTDVVLDQTGLENANSRKYSLTPFQLDQRLITTKEQIIFNWKPAKSIPEKIYYKILRKILHPVTIEESQFNFDPDILLKAEKNTYLVGWWQTEKYFSDIRTSLLNDFTIKKPLENKNLEFANKIKSSESVSLHIRRGDYVSNPSALAHHGVCGLDYYANAIDAISKKIQNPVLFIFSDDIQWSKENLKTSLQVIYIENNSEDNSYEDLRLMSLCRHHIIANSSFSWWGAWLNTNESKFVIAPAKWFSNPKMNYIDVVPSNWIKL